MTTWRVARCNGETTQFEFSESVREARQQRRLRQYFSQPEFDYLFGESWVQALKNDELMHGTWTSSDFDSHAAAGDIVAEILRQSGIDVRIKMLREDESDIYGGCSGGTFLLVRK